MKTQYSVLLHNSLMIVLFLPGHSAADSSHYPVKSKNNGGGGLTIYSTSAHFFPNSPTKPF